jgi:hypothetical protein
MEENKLFEINKPSFHEIFFKIAEKDSKVISQKLFFKFLCDLKIFPDLLSAQTLKQLMLEISLKKKGEISENTFFKLVKSIAEICFPGTEPLKSFLLAIKPLSRKVFRVFLITKPANPLKIRKNLKVSPESREISTQRKLLNKSTSQKLSFSGLISPKNSTTVLKKFPILKSPSKNPQNPPEFQKIQKISEIFLKFREKSENLYNFNPERQKTRKMFRFVESFLQSCMKKVFFI